MSDHAWVQDNLDVYLAGGLSTDERERLEAHVAGCDACVSALAAAQKLDRTLASLFAPVRPDAALEDRVLRKLRVAKPRRRSLALRFVGAAAAILVMGGLGVVVQVLAAEGGLPFPGMERSERASMANNLKAIGGDVLALFDGKEGFLVKENFGAEVVRRADGDFKADSLAELLVPGTVNPNEALGIINSDKATSLKREDPKVLLSDLDGLADNRESKAWAESERVRRNLGESEGRRAGGAGEVFKDSLSANANGRSEPTKRESEVREMDSDLYYRRADGESKLRTLSLLSPEAGKPSFGRGPAIAGSSLPTASGGSSAYAGDANLLSVKPQEQKRVVALAGADAAFVLPEQKANKGYYSFGLEIAYDNRDSALRPTEGKGTKAEEFSKKQVESINKMEVAKATGKSPYSDLLRGNNPDVNYYNSVLPQQFPPSQPPKQSEPPVDPSRKIIRTGELDFEIDSFDKAVANVATLINAVKGGFVATVNSDKLPNGKVRGSVVVRMPPQFLDKFLLDLRKELGKVGELKTQRIGSQDVTKQYTDIESRLKAARTMEERFLAIIKNGKGEVKDLIAAERELGVWRTKIEEMEGEIRYYNNQVGLSTLTITLTEKEIQAAAAVVITERVGMKIEVEDVEKAHIDALKAVADEKGRITKSELKQHPAGQLEAILQVEVAPEKAKKLREMFKKLGLVTFNDVQRVQQAVGGGKAGEFEGKLKQADVQIHVTLYDTANIQPRESVTMLIATDDVQASYRALQAAVVKAKGQIRVGQLREPEKITINAEFNFDVPSPEKPGIDKMLAKLGVILSSTDVQVPINETATDRKYGYRLVLRNLATVPARESTIQAIAVNDVPTIFREVQDAVLAAKGIIHVRQLTEQDKVNIRAELNFDIPKGDRAAFDKVLAKLGDVLTSSSVQAGPNEITTDRKFGYRLSLLNLASIRPREIVTLELVTNDVRGNFQEVRDAVKQAKGILYLDRLIEDTPQQTQGKLDFDVAMADKAAIEKLLAKSGAVLKRSSSQANVNELASDRKVGFRVLLHSIASVPPREKVTLVIKVDDVNARAADLAKQVRDAKGQASRPRITQSAREMNASLVFDVPLASEDMILRLCKESGRVLDEAQTQNLQVPDNELATAQITVTLTGPREIIPNDETFWTPIQQSLEITFRAFAWSITVVILGLSVVLPWVIAIWLVVKIVRKLRGHSQPA